MWQAFMDWLPGLRVGTFETRDLVNLVIAGLGAYLALQAIRMGRRQEAIAKRQAEIAEVTTPDHARQPGSVIRSDRASKRIRHAWNEVLRSAEDR